MAKLYADDTFQAIDDSGNVISGARLFFYEVGTSTKQSTFTDDALSVANTNPVVCDSDGRPPDPIYFSDADYKVGLAAAGVDDPPAVFIRTTAVVHGASTIPTTGTLSKSVDYTVVAADKGSMILVDASAAERTITLIGVTDEFQIAVKKTDSSTNAVIVDGAGSELIDGSLTLTLECQYDAVSLRSDATSWSVESRFNEFPAATASKTASYEVLASDIGRTLLIDATTVTFAAGIQGDDSGASFIDETTDLNSAAANDVAFFPAGAGVDDAFYFGSDGKFAGAAVNVGTAGIGTYAVTWEYWDASNWVALSGVTDGTSGFQVAGLQNVTFQVPADWDTTTVNAQGPFYYVRAKRNAGTVTTDPLGTQAFVFTTILLPPVATAENGFSITVKKTDASTNAVTVAASGSEPIDGETKRTLSNRYDSESYLGDGAAWNTVVEIAAPAPLLGTPIATTSGTAHDFTDIRATAKRITIIFNEVSLSGTDDLLIQLGDSVGFETAGYLSESVLDAGVGGQNGSGSTSGFLIRVTNAAYVASGRMVLSLFDGAANTWIEDHNGKLASSTVVNGGGSKTLSDTLTQVRVTRTGTNTFDAGSVNILVE